MTMSPLVGCGTLAGLAVGQALFMAEWDAPPESYGPTEPRLKPATVWRAPGWLSRLLAEPGAENRTGTVKSVYGQVVTPAGRGLNDTGKGANTPSYNWGKGQKLG
ncbi:14094_t:CDS:1, partial [Acaulospora colombiana]